MLRAGEKEKEIKSLSLGDEIIVGETDEKQVNKTLVGFD